jgi:hypothetical protein
VEPLEPDGAEFVSGDAPVEPVDEVADTTRATVKIMTRKAAQK